MYIHDSHIHSKYSFDGDKGPGGEISSIIEAAIAAGIDEISITDHCDIDNILDGIYPEFPADVISDEILSVREKYKDRIRVNLGIELGEPHARNQEAMQLLSSHNYEFVIGSVHNLRAYPDFAFLKFEMMPPEMIDYLIRRNLSELCELAGYGCFSALAHITYIQRYLDKAGCEFNYKAYADEYERLFGILIKSGCALEINTSGLRRGSITMPGRELLGLYREVGGELITIGSDAHRACDIGTGIIETANMLRDLGFRSQCVVRGGVLTQIEL